MDEKVRNNKPFVLIAKVINQGTLCEQHFGIMHIVTVKF